MSINLTDEIEVKTKKGKLGSAKQIFLEGDTQTVEKEIQDINSRHNTLNTKHESLSKTVQGIAATGGASTANNVTYDNNSSGLNAENAQDAIDELQSSKIDKTSILQESGEAEDKVMSQKAVSAKLSDLVKKENGKKLIDSEYSDGISTSEEYPEFANYVADENNRLIESIEQGSGKKTIYTNLKVCGDLEVEGDSDIKNLVKKENGKKLIDSEYSDGISTSEEYPEFANYVADENNRLIESIEQGSGKKTIYTNLKVCGDLEVEGDSDIKDKDKKNILFRKIDSSHKPISITIDVRNRNTNTIFIGVLENDFSTYYRKYSIYVINKNGGEKFLFEKDINSFIQQIDLDNSCKYIKFVTENGSPSDISINVWNDFDIGSPFLYISNKANKYAHFVCDGVNDEQELSEALALIGWHGTIKLSSGVFYIDKMVNRRGKYGAMIKGKTVSWNLTNDITIEGVSKNSNEWGMGTKIYTRSSSFDNVPEGEESYVIGTEAGAGIGTLRIKDINFSMEDNTHKYVIINGQYLGALIVDSCTLSGGANKWSDIPPQEGSVGLRGIIGNCNGSNYVIKNTYAIALYEGFQLGGEHLFAYELGTRFCYYGYTFGNYDYGSWFTENSVTASHPLVLINCCDEGSRALPLFAKCGVQSSSNAKALQEVDLIGFNLEVHTANLLPARELTPGSFCGKVTVCACGSSNSEKDTQPSAEFGNRVDTKFWEDNSGRNFQTINMTHKLAGTTAERNGYYANYMQNYFDLDLNKMLICIDTAKQKWVDVNGIEV